MVKLIYYLRGYVSLLLSGQFVERFINICMHRGLFLWDIRKAGTQDTQVKMSLRAFRQTIPIARKTHTHVKIIKKHGLPIRLAAYKKRTFFLLGLLFAVCFLYASSLFIWTVDITGCKLVSEAEVRAVLAELGVKPGTLKTKVDASEMKERALAALDDVRWIWVDVRGCRVHVQVLEKRPAPEILSTEPCDIIAATDGVITEIRATDGNKVVEVGDTVLRGQVLISAVMPSERIEARYTHAGGLVYARTWYEESLRAELKRTEKQYSGEAQTHRTLLLGNLQIPLSFRKQVPDARCTCTQNTHTLVLFGIDTHIAYQSKIYRPYTKKVVDVPREIAIRQAEEMLDARIASMLCDKDGVRTDVKTAVCDNGDGTITVTRTAEYKEQIGTEVKLHDLAD